MSHDPITADLGRKCADDVSAAIHRTLQLCDDRKQAMIVAAFAAAAAVGASTGSYCAFADKDMDEATIDNWWAMFLRPMALGQLSTTPNTPGDE